MNKSTVKAHKIYKAICAAGGGLGLAILLSITSNNAAACRGPEGSACHAGSGACKFHAGCRCKQNSGKTDQHSRRWGTCLRV